MSGTITALQPYRPQVQAVGLDMVATLEDAVQLSERLKTAEGLIPQPLNTPGKILAVILAGRERNIPPMTALQHLYVVKGKVGMSYQMMLAKLREMGGDIQWVKDGTDGKEAELKLRPPGASSYDEHVWRWSMDDAKRAGLGGDSWRKHPANMLRARCLSNAIHARCPEVTMGAYSMDEMQEIIDVPNGPIVESTESTRMAQQEREKAESNELLEAWIPMIDEWKTEKDALDWIYFHGFAASAMHTSAKSRLWTRVRKRCDQLSIDVPTVKAAWADAPEFPDDSETEPEPPPEDYDEPGSHDEPDPSDMPEIVDPESGMIFGLGEAFGWGKKYSETAIEKVPRHYMHWVLDSAEEASDTAKAKARALIAWKDARDSG